MFDSSQNPKGYQLRSGLFVLPKQEEEFIRIITELQHNLPANFIMLTDVAGQVIAVRGDYNNKNLVMLGSLVAGDLAASQEIARLMGEYQDYQLILREGQRNNNFIAEAGSHLILLTQVNRDVPIGWARMLILKTSRQLAKTALQGTPSAQEIAEMERGILQPPDDADKDLAELFGEALDDLWGE